MARRNHEAVTLRSHLGLTWIEETYPLGTKSEKFTCVCFGTERLTPLGHSVLVLAPS